MRGKDVVAVVCLFLILSVVGIGNKDYRIANSHLDDSVASLSQYAKNPDHWGGDVYETYAGEWSKASLLYWGAELLVVYLGAPADICHYALMLMQDVLLPVSIFFLVYAITHSRAIAYVGCLFSCSAEIWQFNLAIFRSVTYILPYAGQIVYPFVLAAAVFYIKKQKLKLLFIVTLASFVHINIASQFCVIIVVSELLSIKKDGVFQAFYNLSPLASVPLVALALMTILQAGAGDRVPTNDLMIDFAHVQHFYPWLYGGSWGASLSSFGVVMSLTALALSQCRDLPGSYLRLVYAAVIAVVALALVHWFGALASIPLFVKAVPLRATSLLILFSVPLAATYLVRHTTQSPDFVAGAAVALLVSASLDFRMVPWGAIIPLALYDFSCCGVPGSTGMSAQARRVLGRISRWGFAVWGGALVVAYFVCQPALEVLMPHHRKSPLGWAVAMVAVALSYAVVRFAVERKGRRMSAQGLGIGICCVALVLSLANTAYTRGARTWGGDKVGAGNVAAQEWARDNTPSDAVFMSYKLPFRGLSGRRLVMPQSSLVLHRYTESRATREFEVRYRKYYGLEEEWKTLPLVRYRRLERKLYYAMDAGEVARMAREFGADYVVRLASKPLALPEAFRSGGVVVYRVPKALGAQEAG